jgi:acyl-CoA thioesterase
MSPEPGDAREDDRARAMRRAAALWAEDACARGLGMVIVEVGPGRAVLELTIEPWMVDGHGRAHAGLVFTLAATALGFAANSGEAEHHVDHAQISLLRAVPVGARLRAEASPRHRRPGAGLFDVTVSDAGDEVVAELRGHSRAGAGDVDETPA